MAEYGPEDERLMQIYERLDELDPSTFEARAAELLHGLGFTKPMMERKTRVRGVEEQVNAGAIIVTFHAMP